jgi:hypothetical protein
MADMTQYEMLDDVNLALVEPLSAGAYAIAGYVNGSFQNWPAIVAKYGKSGKYLLSIDTQGNASAGAQCLDIERFDATIGQAAAWVKATAAAGKAARDLRWYPKVYTSASNAAALVKALSDAGIKRDEYMLWSAHYTGTAHICGPKSCGYPQADATQWTSTFHGASLDASLCYGYFFAGPVPYHAPAEPVKPVEPPEPKPAPVEPVKPPVEPPRPVEPEPVLVVPEPVIEPEPAPAGKPQRLVYVQEVLDSVIAGKLGLPVGTILFIPHTVEGD